MERAANLTMAGVRAAERPRAERSATGRCPERAGCREVAEMTALSVPAEGWVTAEGRVTDRSYGPDSHDVG
ncbi:hypothetical protein Mth01_56140 [Sphaerimonospora thailandensis]|uniref:Uncharacterized protein n=1 Tax=Sphaerimonospora thailandensis TaxID=795644 RepID=A0A8J3RC26_9ACTN|nr:hypothetical protein Mth01_56140 [Sphaerimonospora thailandensis]